jgi:flagellar L-ring protein precursor FlgH
MRLIFLLLISQLTVSCASYIEKFHRQFDAQQGIVRDTNSANSPKDKRGRDRFDFYRQPRDPNKVSSRQVSVMRPKTKRTYNNSRPVRRRYKANDLYDNGGDGSLWQSNTTSGFLFGVDTIVSSGDIVVINVQKDLKSDIAGELKRAFPTVRPKPVARKTASKGKAGKDGANKKEEAKTAAAPGKKEEVGETKIYDKVSSIVVEEINGEHLLLKGRKYLLYKGKKRAIEVQALVARRDVKDDKTLNSDNILEATLRVIQ